MSMNALQAVLDKAASSQPAVDKPVVRERVALAPSSTPRERPAPKVRGRTAAKPSEETAEPSKHYRPVRDGKRFVGAHFHPEVARQLKVLAAEDDTTIQELLEQAVDLLFVKNGKAKITDLERKG